jgi:hypothetical protein
MNPHPKLKCLIALLGTVAAWAATPEWPEWRGPGGQGHAARTAHPPIQWSETEGVLWKTAIPGRGWSSPVIDGKQIWLSTAHETAAKPEDAKRRLAANTADQPLVLLEKVDLHAVCARLATLEFNEVLVESGPMLAGALLDAGLVDELVIYLAPMLLGATARSAFATRELLDLSDATRFRCLETRSIGRDLRLTLTPALA